MDTKFIYHPIIPSSHLGEDEEEEDTDLLLDDLPFSRLKEVQTESTMKEEFHLSQACSSLKSEEAQQNQDAESLIEHPFSVSSVVMMQRIISYIAYLENSISSLCSELGMHFNSSGTPLVNRLKRKVEARAKASKKKDAPLSEIKYTHSHHYGTRRLKLSSPTVDSTTDTVPIWTPNNDYVNSQDSSAPSSTFVALSSNENSSSTWQVESDSDEDIISHTGFIIV
ncbi:uncharacterized protein LOC121369850 [Gigantopelta aegis]|uniref:uncharacterized protein LOC121369850 n=1 Tax=Gigantopelta aegis TaxID=1735272 RepID=UPI001B88C5B1|nr:uncharacterized protein LOC121369850 [Gigantopelta aegis]